MTILSDVAEATPAGMKFRRNRLRTRVLPSHDRKGVGFAAGISAYSVNLVAVDSQVPPLDCTHPNNPHGVVFIR